jgi:hypothetical protein
MKGNVDNPYMKKETGIMIQWIGVIITICGLVYTGLKDVQSGAIKIPAIKQPLTKVQYPIQYCLMAYDPNTNKVYYQHENGIWYDYAPTQRRYSTTPEHSQDQGKEALGVAYGTSGRSQHAFR